jgi:hypothetical protein
MSWRETAKVYTRKDATAVFAQLDQLESRLQPGDWVQIAGKAMRFGLGNQTSGNSAAVYMITTKGIYASRETLFGKWKDMPPVRITDVPSHGFSTVGVWTNFNANTPQGLLMITVTSEEEAEAIAQAVKDAYMHETQGFPLLRPDLPEAAANDRQHTAQHTAAAATAGMSGLVARFRSSYATGDSQGIWAKRCDYGYDIGEDQFQSRSDWFWFNAYPALSGLNLGADRGGMLSMVCGYAEQACDRNDPEQVQVVQEIKRRYFAVS